MTQKYEPLSEAEIAEVELHALERLRVRNRYSSSHVLKLIATIRDLQGQNEDVRARLREFIEAGLAAFEYDQAIQARGWNMEVTEADTGIAYATGDDLDALYADWTTKTWKALRLEKEGTE